MPDTLPTDGLPEPDRKRVEHVNRNIRIREEYGPLKDEHGRQRALQILADRYNVSPGTARRVAYEQI